LRLWIGRVAEGGTTQAKRGDVVVSTLRLFPSREQRRHMLGILRSVQGPTQAQLRCLSCRLYEEDGFEEAVYYCETWESDAALEQHIRSELYRRILSALELSRVPPEVSFYSVSETRHMELIVELRGRQNGDGQPTETLT
jgi:quinol monooxygenase YgiN